MSSDRVDGLRRALEAAPDNHVVRLLLAETLVAEGAPLEALAEFEYLHAEGGFPDALLPAGRAALERAATTAPRHSPTPPWLLGLFDDAAELRHEIDESLGLRGMMQLVQPGAAEGGPPELELDAGPAVTFTDVGGLDDVKKAVHRAIILPFQRRDLYEKYKRGAGGGVLLFGPPGCGKTLVARATAGECGLPFTNVRIEEILDPFIGVGASATSTRRSSGRAARAVRLFIDELDAIAFARRKFVGNAGRPLVDQLLQELDAIGSENENVLVLAATNAPWDVDEAMKRPGRLRPRRVRPASGPAGARADPRSYTSPNRPCDRVDVGEDREEDAALQRRRPPGARRAGRRPRHRRCARARNGACRWPRTISSGRSATCARRRTSGSRPRVTTSSLPRTRAAPYDEVAAFLRSREARSVSA